MKTVAFYSYKGGVGRTLLVANTAQFLAMSGRRVVALDLDLEAPGLHQKIANPDVLSRAESGSLRGAVDALLEALEPEPQHRSLLEMAIEVDLPTGVSGSLFLIPAGSAPSQAYWTALEQLNGALRSDRRDGGLLEAVLELQARIADELAPDFLLIDSRTGITELGGLATSVLADRVVCLTTTAPESVEGTRVVAEALRTAPRLPSQQPLRIDFLVTRVPSGAERSSSVARLRQRFGDSVAVLPHDSAIAHEERVLSGWEPGRNEGEDDGHASGTELFSATLTWIAAAFPGHKVGAEAARRRMEAVHRAWKHLTQTREHVGSWIHNRNAWPLEQLRQRVRFTEGEMSRQADIVAYDRPAGDSSSAKPLMIIEYVDHEDRDTVARWWLEKTRAPVVAVLADNSDCSLYSQKSAWTSRAHPSDRWDLPLPHDFEALADPADVSVDALLDSVRRGHSEYLERLVAEWVHCSAAGLHGVALWKPQIAKKIVDGLARVDDVELARRVLWASSVDASRRGMWLGPGDDWREQVLAELFSPLLWRLPPEAAIEVMENGGRPFGHLPSVVALRLLARDLLGLHYDPDATFRTEGQRILDRPGREPEADQDQGLHRLSPAFNRTKISFELSSDPPPLAARETRDIANLVSELIATRNLVTTGFLGNYEPSSGKVVLYTTAISECAGKLALRARHVGSVTLLHETIHALTHLGRDLDGRMWPEFALPSASDPLFEPSWLHETLAQYFTYQQIVRLRDPSLLHTFETLSAKQAPAYQTWRRLLGLPLEEVRSWFMSIRRGTGSATPLFPGLFEAMRDES